MPKHPKPNKHHILSLAIPPQHLTLLQIFNAVNDKEKLFKIHSNSPKACPLGGKIEGLLTVHFLKAQEALEDSLRSITLQDLLDELINL
ncbi:Rrf2 family transcriptional regulator [Campylobacter concisus]|uniref:Rrf2 family transcriptional regulator n=1 Tax=Campylobacter concisus TaxID=199 RepID=UPI001CB6DD0B|nr:Rrf2 family transcriptional regulator [Campylobacter concisus]